MARRTGSRGDTKLDLTPLIDAVFQLLIFFMVTTTFVEATHLKIELPGTEHHSPLQKEKKLKIRIGADGQFEVSGQLVSLNDLGIWLSREKSQTASTSLVIVADANTPHGFVLDAMEAATQAGVEKIDIETKDETKK